VQCDRSPRDAPRKRLIHDARLVGIDVNPHDLRSGERAP
jgi:hypothetical protein